MSFNYRLKKKIASPHHFCHINGQETKLNYFCLMVSFLSVPASRASSVNSAAYVYDRKIGVCGLLYKAEYKVSFRV